MSALAEPVADPVTDTGHAGVVHIYGASDDLVEVEGTAPGCDEYNTDDLYLTLRGDGRATVIRASSEARGVWAIEAAPLEHEDGLPMHLASLIGHPLRYTTELHKRWLYWTALPGDHWHDFQAMRCYTVESHRLGRSPSMKMQYRSVLGGGYQTEHGTRPPLHRLIYVHPGACRQMVKLLLLLNAFYVCAISDAPFTSIAIFPITIMFGQLVLNARHRDRP